MNLSRRGSKKDRGKYPVFSTSSPSVYIYSDKISISAYSVTDKHSQNTYDYTIKLSFNEFANILGKINEEYTKNPSTVEKNLEDHTKTLLRSLIISSGLQNNPANKPDK